MSIYIYIYIYTCIYIYIYTDVCACECVNIMHIYKWDKTLRSASLYFWCMLTYADVCWRMLTYADVCWRMLTYADKTLRSASLYSYSTHTPIFSAHKQHTELTYVHVKYTQEQLVQRVSLCFFLVVRGAYHFKRKEKKTERKKPRFRWPKASMIFCFLFTQIALNIFTTVNTFFFVLYRSWVNNATLL